MPPDEKLILMQIMISPKMLLNVPYLKANPFQKFHELSSKIFWVIVFNVKNVLSLDIEEMEKLIRYPGPDPDQSQNLKWLVLGQMFIIPQNLV